MANAKWPLSLLNSHWSDLHRGLKRLTIRASPAAAREATEPRSLATPAARPMIRAHGVA